MPAQSIEPSERVYQQLQEQYKEQCGRSPSALVDKLNKALADELSSIRSRRSGSSQRDLISDKTLRNFFNSSVPQPLTEKNLNYLCIALLEFESYQAAEDYKPLEEGVPEDWLDTYCQYLIKQFGTVRIPNMTESTDLSKIYTESNSSEDLRVRKNKSIVELQAEMEPGYISNQKKVAISQVFSLYQRLMVWGPAGSGKTTALQARILAAVDKIRNQSDEHEKIPVFIRLREFLKVDSANSMMDAIAAQLKKGGLEADADAMEHAWTLLKHGELLLMMDGLDEVPKDVLPAVQEDISKVVQTYPENHFILTCRHGATDFVPLDFKEVEMIAFDWEQIQQFVKSWFKDSKEEGLDEKFLNHLSVNPNIKELGQNPLTLTMLCTTYEKGYAFPKGASSLFYDATELYLTKWDSSRRIDHRDDIYDGKLSRNRRRNLFYKLSFDGMAHEDEPKYFWRRKELEMFVKDFMDNIPTAKDDSSKRDANNDSRAIISALESQDSLLTRSSSDAYTFSYRSFQKYFTAMHIIEFIGSDTQELRELLKEHKLKEDWREVLVFAVERSPKASDFFIQLFHLAMEQLAVGRLAEVICVCERIADWGKVSSSSWRACYLTFDLKTDINISHRVKGIDEKTAQRTAAKLRRLNQRRDKIILRTPLSKLVLDLAVLQTLMKDRASGINTSTTLLGGFDSTYINAQKNFEGKFKESIELAHQQIPELGKELDRLLKQMPDNHAPAQAYDDWADQLRAVMIKHLYGNELVSEEPIMLDAEEVEALNNYLHLLELLVDCLSADVYCPKSLWTDLVDSLVLPPFSDKIPKRILTCNRDLVDNAL